MVQVRLYLCTAESFAAFCLGLVFVALLFIFSALTSTIGLVFGNALGLGFLVRGSFGEGLGLGLGGLALLLALYLGILGGIPRVKNLASTSALFLEVDGMMPRSWKQVGDLLTSASSSSSSNWRRRAAVTGGDEGGVLSSLSSSSGVKSGQLNATQVKEQDTMQSPQSRIASKKKGRDIRRSESLM
jgi:hypothetical protein